MTIDPDIRTIQRQRRQAGRCVACGTKIPRSALCAACRTTLAYCPMCEAVYPRRAGLDRGRSTEYCRDCGTKSARKRTGARTYDAYLADVQQRRRQFLPEIIRRYKRGDRLANVARALGLQRSQVDMLIRDARLRGEWPEELKRYRRSKRQRGRPRKEQ